MTPRRERVARHSVTLDCGHQVTYTETRPDEGDVVWCVRCDTGRVVTAQRSE